MLTTQRYKCLGCGIAQQQLPRSPTFEIHESVGNHSSKPTRGVQSGSTNGLQGMEGTSLGGELVLVSTCLTVSPLITGGQAHTHSNLTFVYFWEVVSQHLHSLPQHHQSHLHLACLFTSHLCHLPHILPQIPLSGIMFLLIPYIT